MPSSTDKKVEAPDAPREEGTAKQKPLKAVNDWSEIPAFKDRKEEAQFWAEHMLDASLMNSSIHKANVRESTTITLRFDPRMLARIKRIARSRYLNYQSMIKQWLSERLEQEL